MTFADYMAGTVLPYISARCDQDWFQGTGGFRLRSRFFQSGAGRRRGAVFVLHGFSEFLEKYDEVTYKFLKAGFDVYQLELRGHGYSDREAADPEMVHIDSFRTYIEDVHSYVVRRMPEEGPRVLFAHSMGGGIGASYLHYYPEDFDRVILSSPMCKMRTGAYPWPVAIGLTEFRKRTHRSRQYAAGQTGFPGPAHAEGMTERVRYYYDLRLKNRKFQCWGASYGWVSAAFRNTRVIGRMSGLKVPLLVLIAGRDSMVRPEASVAFARRQPSADYDYFYDAHHEVFNDSPANAARYWADIRKFLSLE